MQTKIERKPNQEEWARFYSAAQAALTEKSITLADFSFIITVDNLKQAYVMLGIRAKRNQMEASQSAAQQTSMASQQQQESARVTGEETRKTIDKEYDRKEALQLLVNEGSLAGIQEQKQGHIDANELTQFMGYMKQQMNNLHAANEAGQQRQHELTKNDHSLDSAEQESQAQREHELATMPPPTSA